MQAFIILCIVGAAFAQAGKDGKGEGKGPDFSKIPGCENAKAVKGIKASTCCAALPKVFGRESFKNSSCPGTCEKGKGGKCCMSDCVLKTLNMADASGKFDATSAKALLKTQAAAWPTDTIVDGCVAAAPATVQKWESFGQKNGTEGVEKKCANPENMAIIQCIRRAFVVQCPTWTQSTDCDTLKAFASSCPAYPLPGCEGKGDKGGKGDKLGKGDKGGKKQDQKATTKKQ